MPRHLQGVLEEENLPSGRFPLGLYSLGDHLGVDAAVRDTPGAWSCSSLVQIQSGLVTRASEGKIWKCQHLPDPMLCGFCVHSLPKALFWPDLILWQ